MTRKLIYILLLPLLSNSLFAQNIKVKNGVIPKSCSLISAGLNIPMGIFSSTHNIGLLAEYQHGISLRHKKATFTYNGTLANYCGKKEIVSSYQYKYPSYSFASVMGGLSYSLFNKTYFRLVTGPAVTLYNKLTGFAVASQSDFGYKINNNIYVVASLHGWTVGASVSMVLK
jgi:hypothetical protein